MIFQEPTTSLNPCFTIGFQLAETLRLHLDMDQQGGAQALDRAPRAGRHSRAPRAASRTSRTRCSGGMNQRVMIAMAIACNPRLLIADEPTTALDVTIQAQILDLLRGLQKERGMALVLVTHNMGVVAEMARRVAVMYAGQVMEEREADALFAAPQHPYTAALLAAMPERHDTAATAWRRFPASCPACTIVPPAASSRRAARTPRRRATSGRRCGRGRTASCAATIPFGDPQRERKPRARSVPDERCREPVSAERSSSAQRPAPRPTRSAAAMFKRSRAHLQAVGGISFAIEAGRTLAVVGESGCGKSTLARVVALIERPSARASCELAGADAVHVKPSHVRKLRKTVQMVFQNPYGSLNPRKKIGAILEAPLVINTDISAPAARTERARAMLAKVGLRPEHYDRYPHMFSGGQRQRIAIARALMLEPALVVADEPVSALDVSVQAQVLNLMADLQRDLGVAYLFISHDLAVVRYIAHDVLVMYLGLAMEQGPKERIFERPLHPYTQALLASTPALGGVRKQRIVLKGELPSPAESAAGMRVLHPLPACHRHLPRRSVRRCVRWTAGWSPATLRKNFCESGHTVALGASAALIHFGGEPMKRTAMSPSRSALSLARRRRVRQDARLLLGRQPRELLSGREHDRHVVRRQQPDLQPRRRLRARHAPRSCPALPRSGTSRPTA